MIDKSSMRVLVVDDEADIRDTLSLVLGSWGFKSVDTASNAAEGLEKLSRASYDLVLLDMIMPRASGWSVLESIHALNTSTRVIVVSAVGLPMVVRDDIARKYKGVEFISKTRITSDLEGLINEVLSRPAAPV